MALDKSDSTLANSRSLFEEILERQKEYIDSNPHKVTDAEIISCFDGENKLRNGNDIARELEVHPKTIYRRLITLEEKGIVESTDLGQVRAWYLSGSLRKSYLSESILMKLRGSMGERYE